MIWYILFACGGAGGGALSLDHCHNRRRLCRIAAAPPTVWGSGRVSSTTLLVELYLVRRLPFLILRLRLPSSSSSSLLVFVHDVLLILVLPGTEITVL